MKFAETCEAPRVLAIEESGPILIRAGLWLMEEHLLKTSGARLAVMREVIDRLCLCARAVT
jgi:hypothetical protein